MSLRAQDQTSASSNSSINTDRPAIINSSVVVPRGSVQIENGFLETTMFGQQGFDFPEICGVLV